MSVTLSAGLALAVPVKPDLLGERLEAYSKVVPVLRALRLCHRFGKGPNVHVTKLPAEIELAIESLIIKGEQFACRWSPWTSAFRHFEGRCDPMSHLEDAYSPLNDGVEDVEECESCMEDHYMMTAACDNRCKAKDTDKCWTCAQWRDPDNCMRTCQAKIHDEMNGMAMDWGWGDFEPINGDCEGWQKMIDQKGNFAKYEKVLREHFGLEVFLSTTRIATEDATIWPRHISHSWHDKETLKTTICYLTLAKHLSKSKTYEENEFEAQCGGGSYGIARAITVKPHESKGQATAAKRFRRTLAILDLKVYLHPSQQDSVILPAYGDDQDRDDRKQAVVDGKTKPTRSSTGWPRMVLLVKGGVGAFNA